MNKIATFIFVLLFATALFKQANAQGLDTRSDKKDSAEFYVIGDGKILWKRRMKKIDAAEKCNVNLLGVRNLLLKVTGSPGDVQVD